ncbi:hypothetical protein CBL_04725 [Carabus blaptoides fortunei]
MSAAYILLLVVLLVSVETYAKPQEISQPESRLLINVAKKIIEKCFKLVEDLVNAQIQKILNIRDKISEIINTAIETAKEAINSVIDSALDTVRQLAQDAIDAGINTTECYIINIDNLNKLRRELILNEVMCAADEMTAFGDIMDEAVNNFTSDLTTVASFPKRLQGCILNITAIHCVTEVINEVSELQKEIPRQIVGSMQEITEYFTGFAPTVHACQFKVLRTAVAETRAVIDHMTKCIRDPENNNESISKV